MRKDARDLTPRWERRELGVQAAFDWAEHPDGSFLERVRSRAGQDLRDARSWEDLDRRLSRHGLRIEPRGAGMIVTDGRYHVKASSVDREASRGKLERRFGETLSAHKARQRQPDGLTPRVQEIVADLRTLDRRAWLKSALAREMEGLEAARARFAELKWSAERAQKALRLRSCAGGSVEDPVRARAAFEERGRQTGFDRAATELRERPEEFGPLKRVEQRRLLGIARVADSGGAREAASSAAELGREFAAATAAAPAASELARAEQAVRRAELRVESINSQLEQTRDNLRTRARIGLGLRHLLPHQANDLHRTLTAPHRQLTLDDFRPVVDAFRDLFDHLRCPGCAGLLRTSRVGIERVSLGCPCGRVHIALTRPSGA